ncbi:MAG: ankyrin repeat domain-containing protein [Proteobacteria bacterium]|nr:ankyrin repeat domain-containing protein [Pseudomonadota bacterium]
MKLTKLNDTQLTFLKTATNIFLREGLTPAEIIGTGCHSFGTAEAFNQFVEALKVNPNKFTGIYIAFEGLTSQEIKQLNLKEFNTIIKDKLNSGEFRVACGGLNIFDDASFSDLVEVFSGKTELTSFRIQGSGSVLDLSAVASIIKNNPRISNIMFGGGKPNKGALPLFEELAKNEGNRIGTMVLDFEVGTTELIKIAEILKKSTAPGRQVYLNISINGDKQAICDRFYKQMMEVKENTITAIGLRGDFVGLNKLRSFIEKQKGSLRTLRLHSNSNESISEDLEIHPNNSIVPNTVQENTKVTNLLDVLANMQAIADLQLIGLSFSNDDLIVLAQVLANNELGNLVVSNSAIDWTPLYLKIFEMADKKESENKGKGVALIAKCFDPKVASCGNMLDLLKTNAYFDNKDSLFGHILFEHIKNFKNIVLVEKIIEILSVPQLDAVLKQQNIDGYTPLHYLLWNKKTKESNETAIGLIINKLGKEKFKELASITKISTPNLLTAQEAFEARCLQSLSSLLDPALLVQEQAPEQKQKNHRMFDGIKHNNLNEVIAAIDSGANLYALDDRESYFPSALHHAVSKNSMEILRYLVEQKGMSVTIRNASTWGTPLHLAVQSNNLAMSEYFLDHGAKIDAREHTGFTPLHYAIYWPKLECYKMLINRGASLLVKSDMTTTNNSNKETHYYLTPEEMLIKFLAKAQADKNTDKIAAYTQMYDYLSIRKADPERQILVAAKNNDVVAVQDLISKGYGKYIHAAIADSSPIKPLHNLFDRFKPAYSLVNFSEPSGLEIAKLLLKHRTIFSPESIDSFVSSHLNNYKGSYANAKNDHVYLNNLASQLIGTDVSKIFSDPVNLLKYYSHMRSFSGNKAAAESEKLKLEGFWPDCYLAMRIRLTLELLFKLQKRTILFDEGDGNILAITRLKSLLSSMVETYNIIKTHEKLGQYPLLLSAFVDRLSKNILELPLDGRSHVCISSGWEWKEENDESKPEWKPHAIYLTFRRILNISETYLEITVHNLGDSSDLHPFKTLNNGGIASTYRFPYTFEVREVELASKDGLKKYLMEVLDCGKEKSKQIDIIYNRLSEGRTLFQGNRINDKALDARYRSKRQQTAGNCSVKNHQHIVEGLLGRELYRWFREEELRLLPSKYLGFKNVKSKGRQETSGSELGQLNQEILREALRESALHGYNNLHLAVVTGDVRAVKEELSKTDIDITATTLEGYNSLHLAVVNGSQEIAELLVKKAKEQDVEVALLSALTNDGESVKDICAESISHESSVKNELPTLENFKIEPVEGDGHCLFRAVGFYVGKNPDELREIVANYLEKNLEQYRDIISAVALNGDVEGYIQAMRHGNEWADHLEIVALMRALGRPIVVIDSEKKIRNLSDIKQIKGDPIFVYYNGHNHYDGLILTEEDQKQSEVLLEKLVQPVPNVSEQTNSFQSIVSSYDDAIKTGKLADKKSNGVSQEKILTVKLNQLYEKMESERRQYMHRLSLFTPEYGTSLWLKAIAKGDKNKIAQFLDSEMNPENISFITIKNILDDNTLSSLVQRGGIDSLAQLGIKTDLLIENVIHWQKHRRVLRRLEAGISMLIEAVNNHFLPDDSEQELRSITVDKLNALWSDKERIIPTEIKEALTTLAKSVYTKTFSQWRSHLDFDGKEDLAISFWQGRVVSGISTMLNKEKLLSDYVRNKTLKVLFSYLKTKNISLPEETEEKILEMWKKTFMESHQHKDYFGKPMTPSLIGNITKMVDAQYQVNNDMPRPHYQMFYEQAAAAVWDDFVNDRLKDEEVSGFILRFIDANVETLLEGRLAYQLRNISIETLLLDYKEGKLDAEPVKLVLRPFVDNIPEYFHVEKIHASAKESLGQVVLKELVDKWRESELNENVSKTLDNLIVGEWVTRQQQLRFALNPSIKVENGGIQLVGAQALENVSGSVIAGNTEASLLSAQGTFAQRQLPTSSITDNSSNEHLERNELR